MDTTRTEKFRTHLNKHIIPKTNKPFTVKTVREHIRKINRTERLLGVNLDKEAKDGRKKIYDILEYSQDDADNNRPHKEPRMKFKEGKTGTANGCRNSIKEYQKCCGDFK